MDKKKQKEVQHFIKTFRPMIPGKIIKHDREAAFIMGYNSCDRIWRGKSTEAQNTLESLPDFLQGVKQG